MTDSIADGRDFWNGHARRDPLWAILSDPAKTGRRWQIGPFLETGRREISLLMYQLRALDLTPPRAAALDFGCGVGRLTQPLADYFERVVGVDISAEMIRLADLLNAHPGRVRYVCNDRPDLSVFEDGAFSLMYSNVVLQHIEPALSVGYLRDLFRVVASGGVLVFQLPSHLNAADARDRGPSPMPEPAYRATVRVLSVAGASAEPGETLALVVSVTNDSPLPWTREAAGVLRAGNHWRAALDNRMLIQDDARALLPPVVQPGETCTLTLRVKAPDEPGRFVLEVDVVHEGISWFADKGSAVARIEMQVGEGAPSAGVALSPAAVPADLVLPDDAGNAPDPGPLPMHGVPRADVEAMIAANRGTLVHVETDERCGPEWVGYRYFVRKG